MRRLACVLALTATPLLHGLAFPPANLHLLAWVAFVPWFAAIRLVRARTAFLLSGIATLAGTYLVASWLPRAAAGYYGQPFLVGALLFVGAWCVTLAPWVLAFAAAYRAMAARRSAWMVPLLVGAAWTGMELGRVRGPAGDPFGLLGYSQARIPALVQIADVTGVYGVSFLLAAVNAALVEVALSFTSPRRRAGALGGLALVGVLVALVLVYGRFRLGTPAAPPETRVAIAQGNLDLGSQWREEFYGRNLEEYMRLTLQTLHDAKPALVVWPESAMTFFLEDEPLYRHAIGRLLSPFGVQLLAGGPRALRSADPVYYNAAFLISPEGEILARYEKQRLLPFAEYFPFTGIALLRRQFARVREFTPGAVTDPLPTAAGPAGIVICNEAMFPELVARRVRSGAALLVNLSNDSWLGDAQFSAEALDVGLLRAIEQRRYLIRASTSGPSAIIDPLGRIVAQTEPFSRATVAGMVEAVHTLTPYAALGDAFGFLCMAATLLAVSAPGPRGVVSSGSGSLRRGMASLRVYSRK